MYADHTLSPGWGKAGYKHLVDVLTFARSLRAKTILDYGCGKGTLRSAILEKKPFLVVDNYDPGMPEWSVLPPGPYDLVTCTHVLEHVEPAELDETLRVLDSRMAKGGFFVIPHGPARAVLLDGRNAHLIQESWDWWHEKLKQVWSDVRMRPNVRGTAYFIRKQ